ncbi:MAG TPA: ion transporter [Candidatus Angelobacter sp.]|nr:ion transporter [Candidatus Angelobacter sp.]
MGLLAVAYLTIDVLADGATGVPVAVIFVFTAVFGGEFAVRFANARNRKEYLRHHWLDLVSSLPMVGPLRAVRLLRLLRLVRAAKGLNAIQRQRLVDGGSPGGLSLLLIVFTVIWFGAALCYWSLDHTYNPDARTFGDALYWAFLTMTTMGYGTASTLNADTRVLAGVVIFVGVGLVSLVSGRVASMMLHDDSDTQVSTRLAEIETELRRLRLSLERRDERDPPAA